MNPVENHEASSPSKANVRTWPVRMTIFSWTRRDSRITRRHRRGAPAVVERVWHIFLGHRGSTARRWKTSHTRGVDGGDTNSMTRGFGRLQAAFRKLVSLVRRESPGMIGTPPSQRRIPEDIVLHARQFANEYADRLENYVEGRMHQLEIPEHNIGLPDRSRGVPWAVFHPNGITGGSVVGERIAVNSGVLNPELLTERYGPEIGKIWANSRLRDRIDAVLAHELAEAEARSHEEAEALAARTDLAVSEGTRRVLRAMAGRIR